MKDKRVVLLEDRVLSVENELDALYELSNVSIKECPKCKHEVMAKGLVCWDEVPNTLGGVDAFGKFGYKCLTCGVKFTCTKKEVCEVVE